MPKHAPPEEHRCKAKSKRTGQQCRNWRHVDENGKEWSVCFWHGARGGAPKGNKNNLRTGEHEAIWYDTLTDEEKELYRQNSTQLLDQLDREIKLLDIRERRMLQRIQDLSQAKMTVVEESEEKGTGAQGPIDKKSKKKLGTLGQIQDIEEALTRVQAQKTRLLELKFRIENGDIPEGDVTYIINTAIKKPAPPKQAGG